MRKVIYIFVALLAFVIGTMSFYFRPLIQPVSLCEIKQNARLYDKREVYVRAYLEVLRLKENEDDDYFDVVSSLGKGCIEGASLEYSEQLKQSETLKQLCKEMSEANKELIKTKFDEGWYLVEVEIFGQVDDLSDDGITHCFTPDLSLKVKELKQTSPIHFVSRQEIFENTPK